MEERRLWKTPGGVHPPEHKAQSLHLPLAELPLPKTLVFPLNQHVGTPAEAVVAVGEQVKKGQLIAAAKGDLSANIHASTSGKITAIEDRPLPHPSGLPGHCIVLEADGKDEWTELQPCADYQSMDRFDLLQKIRGAGVVGMGGAGFPAAIKLNPSLDIHTLIINGTECEPYITSDDMLMRNYASDVVAGTLLLSHLLWEPANVLVAIEDNKPAAIEAMREAFMAADLPERFAVVPLPTKYPSGGEKQLVQMLTGHEVPSGKLPAHVGAVCQNVATAVAAYRAVVFGEPLISRITTVTGEAFQTQRNVKVLLGTPVSHVLAQHGFQRDKASRLVMGGPMMGFTLLSEEAPVIKTTNCLLAPTLAEAPPPPPMQACIRCGMCAEACPASLLPQQLFWYARAQDQDKLKDLNLFDCIECGACSYACPSHIPLVQFYRAAKGEIRETETEKAAAARARERFEFHKERIEKEKEARALARQEAAEKAKQRQLEKEAQQQAAAKPNSPDATAASSPSEITAKVEAVAGEDQQARLERNLLSAQDRLDKLREKLAAPEGLTPEQVNALRARVREAELKVDTCREKLKAAIAAATAVKPAKDPGKASEPTANVDLAAETKPLGPELNGAEVSAESEDAANPRSPSASNLSGEDPAVAKLKRQLEKTEARLAAADSSDSETVHALKLAVNLLKDRIRAAEAGETHGPSAPQPKAGAEGNKLQRAMEESLSKRELSPEQVQLEIAALQDRLLQAQLRLKSGIESDPRLVSELRESVENLEQKLEGAKQNLRTPENADSQILDSASVDPQQAGSRQIDSQ